MLLCAEQNVSDVKSIMPTEEITSALNFYLAVTPAAVACANKAYWTWTKTYDAQIDKLFAEVSSGKPAVCFFQHDIPSLIPMHGILLTGAYTDGDGNRWFLGYDNLSTSYCNGKPQVYAANYGHNVYYGSDDDDFVHFICNSNFAWLSDPSCLASFKADGDTDPTAWYAYYRAHREAL